MSSFHKKSILGWQKEKKSHCTESFLEYYADKLELHYFGNKIRKIKNCNTIFINDNRMPNRNFKIPANGETTMYWLDKFRWHFNLEYVWELFRFQLLFFWFIIRKILTEYKHPFIDMGVILKNGGNEW